MRKRTGKKYVPITISLENQIINELEMELKPKQSRSKWIADAIEQKLNGEDSFNDASSSKMVSELCMRSVITSEMRDALYQICDKIKASTDEHSNQ